MQSICLSFWHVGLSNLPVGTIRKRVLPTEEARSLINQARAAGKLLCVCEDDLGAPYCKREREQHEELCAALRQHADISIDLEDFFGADCSNPLCFALISEEQGLLVVDCDYGLDGDPDVKERHLAVPEGGGTAGARRDVNALLKMSVLPETIVFYLLEVAKGDRPAYEADDGPLTDEDIEVLRKTAEAALPKGRVSNKQSLF